MENDRVEFACLQWLSADGWYGNDFVLQTLQSRPHQDLADEILEFMQSDNRDAVLTKLAELQKELEE